VVLLWKRNLYFIERDEKMKKRILIISAMLLLALLNVSTVFAADVGSVEGGGQIIEASNGAKRPEWSVISFGGWVQSDGATIIQNFRSTNLNFIRRIL
jgi:hypothetical protein